MATSSTASLRPRTQQAPQQQIAQECDPDVALRLEEATARMKAALAPHREVVMFAQRVMCWDVPLVSLPYAVVLHIIWYILTSSEASMLSLVCQILCAASVIDLVTTGFRSSIVGLIVSSEEHFAGGPNASPGTIHSQARMLSFQKYMQLRTFDELCAALAFLSTAASRIHRRWTTTHNQRPGKISLVSTVTFFLLAFVFSYVSGTTISYLFLLAILTFPALERCSVVRSKAEMAFAKFKMVAEPVSIVLNKIFKKLPERVLVVRAPGSTEDEEEDEAREAQALAGLLDGSAYAQRQPSPTGLRRRTQPRVPEADAEEVSALQGLLERTALEALASAATTVLKPEEPVVIKKVKEEPTIAHQPTTTRERSWSLLNETQHGSPQAPLVVSSKAPSAPPLPADDSEENPFQPSSNYTVDSRGVVQPASLLPASVTVPANSASFGARARKPVVPTVEDDDNPFIPTYSELGRKSETEDEDGFTMVDK